MTQDQGTLAGQHDTATRSAIQKQPASLPLISRSLTLLPLFICLAELQTSEYHDQSDWLGGPSSNLANWIDKICRTSRTKPAVPGMGSMKAITSPTDKVPENKMRRSDGLSLSGGLPPIQERPAMRRTIRQGAAVVVRPVFIMIHSSIESARCTCAF